MNPKPSPKSTRRSRDMDVMNLFQRCMLIPCGPGKHPLLGVGGSRSLSDQSSMGKVFYRLWARDWQSLAK